MWPGMRKPSAMRSTTSMWSNWRRPAMTSPTRLGVSSHRLAIIDGARPALVFTSRKTLAKSRTRHAWSISAIGEQPAWQAVPAAGRLRALGKLPHCGGYATSLILYFSRHYRSRVISLTFCGGPGSRCSCVWRAISRPDQASVNWRRTVPGDVSASSWVRSAAASDKADPRRPGVGCHAGQRGGALSAREELSATGL